MEHHHTITTTASHGGEASFNRVSITCHREEGPDVASRFPDPRPHVLTDEESREANCLHTEPTLASFRQIKCFHYLPPSSFCLFFSPTTRANIDQF